MIFHTPGALQAFRIASGDTPGDTNDFACLLGPIADGAAFTMMPDEEIVALIRSGTPVSLDAEDLSVLRGGP